MKKIVVWTLVLAGLLIAFVLILYSCSNEASERLGDPEETTQQATVPEETVEQYDLPRTGGFRF